MTNANSISLQCFGGPMDGRIVTVSPGSNRYYFPMPEYPEEIPWAAPADPYALVEHKVVTYVLRRHVRRGPCLVWEGLQR